MKFHYLASFIKVLAFALIGVFACFSLLSLITSYKVVTLKSFIILSDSMRPKIKAGSLILVRVIKQEFVVGDIVVFKRPDLPKENITHRITDKQFKDGETLYKTKGDANQTEDIWFITEEVIVGKVMLGVPKLGYLINFSKTKIGVYLMTILPLLVLGADEVLSVKNKRV